MIFCCVTVSYGAFERLEPDEGKLSSPVLRGGGGSNAASLPGTGEAFDKATGLTYLRARYYSAQQGRFLQIDPSRAEENLFLYAKANPIMYTDPSGLFSISEIIRSYEGWNPNNFLNEFELYGNNEAWGANCGFYSCGHKAGPRWGLLAALLEAKSGDHLVFTKAVIPASKASPYLKIDSGARLDYGPSGIIEADGMNLSTLNSHLDSKYTGDIGVVWWRDQSPRYYGLVGSTTKVYVDGATGTQFPDFRSMTGTTTIMNPSIVSKFIEGLSECKIKAGLGAGYSLLVDRFGNVYDSVTLSVGIGISLFSYSEGYITPSAADYVFGETSSYIATSEQMRNAMEGFSGGATVAPFVQGVAGSAALSWTGQAGAGALVYSTGLQFLNFSGDLVIVVPRNEHVPSLGWNWMIDHQMGVGSGYATMFRRDIEQLIAGGQ